MELKIIHLEHGHFRAIVPLDHNLNSVELEAIEKENSFTIDAIIRTVSGCSDEFDEVVQLQVRMHFSIVYIILFLRI